MQYHYLRAHRMTYLSAWDVTGLLIRPGDPLYIKEVQEWAYAQGVHRLYYILYHPEAAGMREH